MKMPCNEGQLKNIYATKAVNLAVLWAEEKGNDHSTRAAYLICTEKPQSFMSSLGTLDVWCN